MQRPLVAIQRYRNDLHRLQVSQSLPNRAGPTANSRDPLSIARLILRVAQIEDVRDQPCFIHTVACDRAGPPDGTSAVAPVTATLPYLDVHRSGGPRPVSDVRAIPRGDTDICAWSCWSRSIVLAVMMAFPLALDRTREQARLSGTPPAAINQALSGTSRALAWQHLDPHDRRMEPYARLFARVRYGELRMLLCKLLVCGEERMFVR